jgi:conjugal transfer pilus assembly protein TraW
MPASMLVWIEGVNIMRQSKNWPIKGAISIGLLVWCLFGNLSAVQAKNLGQVGPVYAIIETGVVDAKKISQKRRFNTLKPLSLPTALAERKLYLDLSYTVPQDIADAEGNIIYPEGYRFNPLEHRRFRTMIVIDGSDESQVDWADNLEDTADPMTRIVITQGDIAAVSKRLKRRVYRLHPQVAQRFRIENVPTIVQQKGVVLAVKAIPLN